MEPPAGSTRLNSAILAEGKVMVCFLLPIAGVMVLTLAMVSLFCPSIFPPQNALVHSTLGLFTRPRFKWHPWSMEKPNCERCNVPTGPGERRYYPGSNTRNQPEYESICSKCERELLNAPNVPMVGCECRPLAGGGHDRADCPVHTKVDGNPYPGGTCCRLWYLSGFHSKECGNAPLKEAR